MGLDEILNGAIPVDVLNKNLPTPEEVTYWQARNNRVFYVDYELDENYNAIELCKNIIQINIEDKDIPKEQRKPILLFIHSFGGDGAQCNALMSVILASETDVITVGLGVVMSSGFDIFLAGKRRYAFEYSQLLTHAGYTALQGTQSEVEEAQRNNKILLEKDKKYLLSRTTIPEAVWKKHKDKDWYFTTEEVAQYNIAKVIHSFYEII